MRKVMYKENERSGYNLEGLFHQWGICNNENGSYTVGIIECPDGRVDTARPWDIKFVE